MQDYKARQQMLQHRGITGGWLDQLPVVIGRRYGRRALKKIWFYQENVNLLIRQLPFSHFVRELLYDEKPQLTDPW